MTESFEQRHATVIREFNEYLFDHPEFTEQIPAGAIVVIQVADDAGTLLPARMVEVEAALRLVLTL
jgi:hypothetical protein